MSAFAIVAALACAHDAAPPSAGPVLRVCADPNALPFSNARGDGFENRIAELVAREMGARVEYTWWAQRRGFVRNTLNANRCDVMIGVPSRSDMVRATRPYYRSTYVFVTRADRGLHIRSFDDPALRTLRVGVALVGDADAASPPAMALARRGITRNVTGYSVYADYRAPNPSARLVDAVANGDIDVAVAWGPLAGYFAGRESVRLAIAPVGADARAAWLPFTFDIGMGVRHADIALRDTLDAVLARRRPAIDSILAAYDVPRAERGAAR